MISFLKGVLTEKTPNRVTIDVNGVGYTAHIPLSTFLDLNDPGQPVELRIYTHMTDSSISLFGFSTAGERTLFLKLIGISGIGPKIALNILSGIGVSDLEEAIRGGDITRIAMVPGIGKKTAMRIALELQEKLEKKEDLLDSRGLRQREDLVSALINLGFKRKEVDRAVDETVKSAPSGEDFETLLRGCLKRLSRL